MPVRCGHRVSGTNERDNLPREKRIIFALVCAAVQVTRVAAGSSSVFRESM